MAKQMNYQIATLEDVALHFQTISNQAYCHLLRYYQQNSTMLRKLQQARMLSRIQKLQAEYDALYGVA
jgi:hypothetical protein